METSLISHPATPGGFYDWLGGLRPVAAKRMGLALALWGEAGIGKTWTAGRLLLETPCKGFSFHATAPLAELSRTLPRPQKLPLWAERVLERLARGECAEASRVADALGALLAALAPVIVHLEDLHEADPPRHELLTALAQQVNRTRGVALLVTSRIQPPEPFEAVRLEPLDSRASAEVLQAEVGASLPEEATHWIYARARGNPLFTLEYLRYLARAGFLWNDGQRWHWRAPRLACCPSRWKPCSSGKSWTSQARQRFAKPWKPGPSCPRKPSKSCGLGWPGWGPPNSTKPDSSCWNGESFGVQTSPTRFFARCGGEPCAPSASRP